MTLQWPVSRMQVLVFDPAYAAVETDDPIYALLWKVSRYQNKVGTWEAILPVDTGLIAGVPVHTLIRRGWHITLYSIEEAKEFVTHGVVQDRAFLTEGGGTVVRLQGAFRALHLTDRSTLTGLEYTAQTGDAIGTDLVDGYIGPGATLIAPALTATPKITFNDITRFEALRKTAEVSRVAIRESWTDSQPEFTKIDDPPDSGVTLQKVTEFDPLASYGSTTGVIADPPSVAFRGHDIVNRIIPIGSDTPDGPLTLASASVSAPYTVQSAVGPNGQTYYYIEDADSIARYGLVETSLVRTDVKNPSDNAGTRTAAANVLYAVAAGLLLKRKSEIMIVDVPVANGVDIDALPGEKMRLTYTGQVLIYA